METLSVREARRLALVRAGLLKPEWTQLPQRASGSGKRARKGAHAVISRFGYLQLDTISVAGARSHTLVLLSRLGGFEPDLGEQLLQPGEPLFEYWGHEACWLPMELYPTFEFRRRDFAHHPWWGDVLGEYPQVADELLRRIRDEGPLRSVDFEGKSGPEMWEIKTAKKVASALWSRGDLAIRERRAFQKVFDLTERVIPTELRDRPQGRAEAIRTLLLRALDGHGFAPTGTLTATWRLRNMKLEIDRALRELERVGEILPCTLVGPGPRRTTGWIRPRDLDLARRARTIRPRRDRGVLLSPFDPVLWDRPRVKRLFGFEAVLEIYKPAKDRTYGYYSMPILAGERLVARADLKADRGQGRLKVRSLVFETDPPPAVDRKAVHWALRRYGTSLGLDVRDS